MIQTEITKLISTKHYVLCQDHFLSNWQGVNFEISLVAISLYNWNQEQKIIENVENRSDIRYIGTLTGLQIKQEYSDPKYHVKLWHKHNASRMYKQGGFE